MKFEVKVGRAFDGEITVVVKGESVGRHSSHRQVLARITVGALCVGVLAAIGYGVATGDYAIIRTIAQSVKEVFVEVAAKIAMKSK